MTGDLEDEYEDTCFVYDCPDSNPSLLKTDSIYNYYGIYSDIGKLNFFTLFLFGFLSYDLRRGDTFLIAASGNDPKGQQ